jgi:hypothetical protein
MNHSKLKLNRRKFLTSIGATAAAVPFLRALPGYGQTDDKRYLILLFSPNGVVRHLWGADVTGPGPGEFTLRPWLAPLEPYKSKLAIVRGLQNKAARGGTHGPGMSTLWTGVGVEGDGNYGKGESIDQAIAKAIAAPTPYPSLEFRARSPQDYESKAPDSRMIYNAQATPIDPREKPLDILSSLFVGIGPADPGSMPTTPAVDPRIELRKKVFTHLDAELGRLSPKMCSDDRAHLDALRTGWSALGERLGSGSGAGASAECAYPEGVVGATEFPKATREMADLLAMSLACDLTRVASLQYSQALSPCVFNWLGHTEDHHTISHAAPQPYALGPNAPVTTDAEHTTAAQAETFKVPIQKMTDINVWYTEEVLYLLDRLSSFPVAGGKTLLDQCIICWGNELDNGSNHDHFNMPFLIIGDGGGKLKTNQVVDFPILDSYQNEGTAERQHNDLLVTLAQGMGATGITSFGESQFNKGAITALLA